MILKQTIKKIITLRFLRKLLLRIFIIFAFYNLIGFFILPPIIKFTATKKLTERLTRDVSIHKISFNPYMLTLKVKDVVIRNRSNSENFIALDELFMNIQIRSLLKRGIIVRELKLIKPTIFLIRYEGTSLNFSDLIRTNKSESKPLRVSFNNIHVVDGKIYFQDIEKKAENRITDLFMTIPFLSNFPDHEEIHVQPSCSGKLNQSFFSFIGKTKPFADSLETSLDINVKDFNISRYLAYVPYKMNFSIGSGQIDTELTFSHIRYKDRKPEINLKGELFLKKFNIQDEQNASVLKLPLLKISIDSFEILAKDLHLSEVSLQSPEVNIVRNKNGIVNLLNLLPEIKEKQKKTKKKENINSLAMNIDSLSVVTGKVSFSDFAMKDPFHTHIRHVDLIVENFTNSMDKEAGFQLLMQTEEKETIEFTGDFIFSSLVSNGMIKLEKIPLKKYSPYFSSHILFDIKDALLTLSTRYHYSKDRKGLGLAFKDMKATIKSVILNKRNEEGDFLIIPSISIKNTTVDLTEKKLSIGNVLTQKGLLLIKRSNSGVFNLQTLLSSPSDRQDKTIKDKQTYKPWRVHLGSFIIEQYTVKVEDFVPAQPVKVVAEKVNMKVENISKTKNSKGKVSLSLKLNEKGAITSEGSVGIVPIFADLKLNLDRIPIQLFQPYFTDRVKILVTSGTISLSGNLMCAYSQEKGLTVNYKGEASSGDFASVNKHRAEDFLKWESLYLEDMDIVVNPTHATIDSVALTNFYSRLIINPDGTLNLKEIIEKEIGKEEEEEITPSRSHQVVDLQKDKGIEKKIHVQTITLQGGHINFSDRYIKPNYTAKLLDLGGRITGLSSGEGESADVDIRGTLEGHAPLRITGKINPLIKDTFIDLKAEVKDFDLSPVSPYSGKYIGYTIEKGKLSLVVKYHVAKNKLNAENQVLLDQLTLGEEVESPDSINLPFNLAIALLKDRSGKINLDIPVQGSLDDPEFKLGKVIIQILINLITKIITSPFAILGTLFGGGEELDHMEFDYGSAMISEENKQKLDHLIKILYERPALRLEIEGEVDVEKDRESLRTYLFERQIKAQKLKEMIKKGIPPIEVDKVKIEPSEYEKYLKKAYKAGKFPKPRNFLGFLKSLPVPEMEKLILTHIKIEEDDLRLLGIQRAKSVKDYIMQSKQIEPERLFIAEPNLLLPEKEEMIKRSRVNMKIK